ncbi:hypothetical protein ASPZODRAFT_153676 [Penicilliopsis zonata CBS 506.65]|uniref:RRM domain-containing protein n=1 Tax=Penicilliopsis zonata CBS 506.65 TaxID=1073090 RepID=A0A1L9SCC7_9EURO|nr:hypothetical protein ASPZODRAFT_153676 [Penicilliopsis zonata CBS 506.65]OJJ44803.1 hypothetical protein ASPZODRAFT_153676 [Penicilliopsis zonata CBS 506.65]
MAEDKPNTEPVNDSSAAQQAKRTLFVRSLPESATTENLAEYFSQSYVLKHAVVVCDRETKKSKGFGFVTFADLDDAKSALEEFNGSVFDGKKIKVEYAESRNREVDETKGRSLPSTTATKLKEEREKQRAANQPPRLIVRNLPWSIKESDDLAVLFRSFGKVKQAIVPKKDGKQAGFGFVVLRGKKNAEKALEAINGKEVDGRTLAVDWAVDKGTWENLKTPTTDEGDTQNQEEKNEGSESGDVDMAEAPEEISDADSVDDSEDDEDIEDLDEDDDEEDEEEEEEQEDERNASTVFIRNLPFTCTDEMLYEHFEQFGRLHYARIVVDPETERPRGTGFACFRNVDDALSCIREAPKQTDTVTADKDKAKKGATAFKQSVLQNESTDPSGRYTLDGRVLQVARAVSRSAAVKLEEEGVSRRLVRDKDKRRLYLLSEGTIPSNSPLYKKLSPTEIKMRDDSFKQRQNFIKKNPALHLSLTRLSIRNIPRHVTSKDLKALAREAVVGFAKDAKNGVRQPLSKEEIRRDADAMKEADTLRKQKRQGIVKQAKIVFESRDGGKVKEDSGAGRSRGYGFIEYHTHRHALMGLRWLNGHAVEAPADAASEMKEKRKRLIVEFAIENAQVVKRRSELQAKSRTSQKSGNGKEGPEKDNDASKNASGRGKKRKRAESNGKDKENKDVEEENKIAKRNRIIAKKRMQRKTRKSKA